MSVTSTSSLPSATRALAGASASAGAACPLPSRRELAFEYRFAVPCPPPDPVVLRQRLRVPLVGGADKGVVAWIDREDSRNVYFETDGVAGASWRRTRVLGPEVGEAPGAAARTTPPPDDETRPIKPSVERGIRREHHHVVRHPGSMTHIAAIPKEHYYPLTVKSPEWTDTLLVVCEFAFPGPDGTKYDPNRVLPARFYILRALPDGRELLFGDKKGNPFPANPAPPAPK
jgi:hypothetical protein